MQQNMQQTDIIQTISIIFSILLGATSIWLVSRQIRIQTKQIKSSVISVITTQVDEINRLLFEYPEVYPDLDKPYLEDLGEKGDRRHHLMHLILNHFEHVFHQHNQFGYIDSSHWKAWRRMMAEIMKKSYANGHWKATKSQYTLEFQKFIEDILRRESSKK